MKRRMVTVYRTHDPDIGATFNTLCAEAHEGTRRNQRQDSKRTHSTVRMAIYGTLPTVPWCSPYCDHQGVYLSPTL